MLEVDPFHLAAFRDHDVSQKVAAGVVNVSVTHGCAMDLAESTQRIRCHCKRQVVDPNYVPIEIINHNSPILPGEALVAWDP